MPRSNKNKMSGASVAGDNVFRLEEATIDELHRAIKDGRTTCVARRPRCGTCVLLDLCPYGRSPAAGPA